jgi:hypothetical protein
MGLFSFKYGNIVIPPSRYERSHSRLLRGSLRFCLSGEMCMRNMGGHSRRSLKTMRWLRRVFFLSSLKSLNQYLIALFATTSSLK